MKIDFFSDKNEPEYQIKFIIKKKFSHSNPTESNLLLFHLLSQKKQ